MSDSNSRRLPALAVALMAFVLLLIAAFGAQAQSGSSTTDDDTTETPSDEPSDDASSAASDEPSEEPTDEPSEEPTDEPTDSTDALGAGLEGLLTSEDVDSDALYSAFLEFLISEYDTTVVVEDDVLSIQIDLQDLQG